ncbi:MAG: CHAD domain-containing protein [Thiotrichales bacterium]|nr:CHAD domain-containing protein [Thiotrichales bacterium]
MSYSHVSLEYATRTVKEFSEHRIWFCYSRVIKQGGRIDKDSSDEQVHELRKSCKKLRYMIEFFREFYPGKKISDQIKQLKKLQNELGEFQDLCVQERILMDFIRALDRDIWTPVSTRQIMDKLRKKIGRQKKVMHRNIPRVFAGYADAKNDKRSRRLFKT